MPSFLTGAPVWVSVPLSPTYAERGSQVLLNWTFSYDASSPSWRKWYEATESGTQIGRTIMTKYQSNAVLIDRPEYEGRLEFVYNGAILLKNVSLSDEGFIRFGVDFTDGEHLQHQIMLNVTSKDIIHTSPCPKSVYNSKAMISKIEYYCMCRNVFHYLILQKLSVSVNGH